MAEQSPSDPTLPEPAPSKPPVRLFRGPDPIKGEILFRPRPLERKRRGILDLEDYIPDEHGKKRRKA